LRDYGTAEWDGGDPECDHIQSDLGTIQYLGSDGKLGKNCTSWHGTERSATVKPSNKCRKCEAKRIDNQIGLEKTPEEYVEKMVTVFREVWRVLRDDGTLWLNMGDCFAGGNQSGKRGEKSYLPGAPKSWGKRNPKHFNHVLPNMIVSGLRPKDLVGTPWRLAFALQADGWYLRSDIIWYKPNPRPESVTDRPTESHEYIFLLTKQPRYYYDAEAIREPFQGKDERQWANTYEHAGSILHAQSNAGIKRTKRYPKRSAGNGTSWKGHSGYFKADGSRTCDPEKGRNKRDVWTVTTQGYEECHFATFPSKLIEPCILAGTSEKGVCPECGAPWTRIVEISKTKETPNMGPLRASQRGKDQTFVMPVRYETLSKTIGWEPSCSHIGEPVPGVTLDPFAGSGTVAAVSKLHKRRSIAIELSPEYCEMATKRIRAAIPGDTIEQANHMRIPEGGLL
jgi:DNA modification methylase